VLETWSGRGHAKGGARWDGLRSARLEARVAQAAQCTPQRKNTSSGTARPSRLGQGVLPVGMAVALGGWVTSRGGRGVGCRRSRRLRLWGEQTRGMSTCSSSECDECHELGSEGLPQHKKQRSTDEHGTGASARLAKAELTKSAGNGSLGGGGAKTLTMPGQHRPRLPGRRARLGL